MQPGALLASLGAALSPRARRCLAGCLRPLAALAVLAVGAAVFSAAASLLGSRQPGAVFHAAAEAIGGEAGGGALHALPLHEPSDARVTAVDDTLASLKRGAFGVVFAPGAIAAMAAAGEAGASAAPLPRVLIDGSRPPLRIDIMGFEQLPGQPPRSAEAPP